MEQGETTSRLPDPGAGFVWEAEPVPHLRVATANAQAVFTTRLGGVSDGPFASLNISLAVGDDDEVVMRNRAIASGLVGGDGAWPPMRQVHGTDVVRVPAEGARVDADAAWTDGPDLLAAKSADCVLLLVVAGERIAVAHAGWRGLVGGVVEKAIAKVTGAKVTGAKVTGAKVTGAVAGAAGAGIEVFAGPAIGPCCFEVREDVSDPMRERAPAAIVGERHVDLWEAARTFAERAGAGSFSAARICTSCRPDLFFSHRRDGGVTGRQALLARIA